jgi:hypothetical protein
MTICIAALSEDGKSCVVAADREVTAAFINLEFEHHDRKIDLLGEQCVVLAAGDALLAAEVIENTRHQIQLNKVATLRQIAESLRDTYIKIHLTRVENVVLKPRGWSFQEFKEKGAQQLPLQVYLNMENQIFGFGLSVVEFLIAGVDLTGAHVFRVHYDGMAGGDWLEWCDRLGYRAVGSGASHASILLSLEGQHRGLPIHDTLLNVYRAKKNSEVAPGVGSATDLAVVSDKVHLLGEKFIDELDTIRKTIDQGAKERSEKARIIYERYSATDKSLPSDSEH